MINSNKSSRPVLRTDYNLYYKHIISHSNKYLILTFFNSTCQFLVIKCSYKKGRVN